MLIKKNGQNSHLGCDTAATWWLIPLSKWVITPVISGLYNPTYPIYNWGYNLLTKWDEPPITKPLRLLSAPLAGSVFSSMWCSKEFEQ